MARKPSLTSPANPSRTSTPLPITPRLVTIKQAAAYCSCSVWAIRDVIWSRELPACKIGRRYLIDRGDLDRFIDARLQERMP
jgi:excisionase family DNA binding protein